MFIPGIPSNPSNPIYYPPAAAAADINCSDSDLSASHESGSCSIDNFSDSDFISSRPRFTLPKQTLQCPGSLIFPEDSFELFRSLDLLYSDVETTIESSEIPTSEIDAEALDQGEVRFLDTRHTSRWEKKKLVVSFLGAKSNFNYADIYILEGLFLSLMEAGFPLYFCLGQELVVAIENRNDLRKSLPLLSWTSYEQVVKAAADIRISREQIKWINWSNIRTLKHQLEHKCELDRPNIFADQPSLKNSFASRYLILNQALELLMDPHFSLTHSGQERVSVLIDVDENKLDDVFHLLNLLPKDSNLYIVERSFQKSSLILQRLPYENLRSLKLRLNKRAALHFSGESTLKKAHLLAKHHDDLNALLNELFELKTPTAARTHNHVAMSLNLTDIIDHHEAILFGDPEPNAAFRTINVKDKTKVLKIQMPLEAFLFHFEGLNNVKEIILNPQSVSDFMTFDTAEKSAKALGKMILKASSTLEKLEVHYPMFESLSEDQEAALQHFFDILIATLSIITFPALKILLLNSIVLGEEPFFLLLKCLPNLDKLVLVNLSIDESESLHFPNFDIPIRTLEIYEVDGPRSTILGLLYNTSRLKVLSAPNLILNNEDKMSLPHLEVAFIENFDVDEPQYVFETCPSLYHLLTVGPFFLDKRAPRIRHHDINESCAVETSKIAKNTGLQPASYTVTPVFESIAYREHRETLHTITYANGKVEESLLVPTYQPLDPVRGYFPFVLQAKARLLVKRDTYTPITGLSFLDTLVNPETDDIDLAHLEFGYDPSLGAFGVKLKTGPAIKEITLRYQMAPPVRYEPDPSHDVIPSGKIGVEFTKDGVKIDPSKWPEDQFQRLNALIHYLKNFKVGDPDFSRVSSESETLNLILKAQCGAACEGRSQLFCLIAPYLIPLHNVLLVKNGCHAYVQLVTSTMSIDIDLGGYPAEVTISEPQTDSVLTPAARELPKLQKGNREPLQASKSGYKEYAERIIHTLSANKTKKPQALLLIKPDQIHFLHQAFIHVAKKEKRNFASLAIDRRQIYGSKTQGGQFIKTTSAQLEVLTRGGVLFLDLSRLSAANIATLLQLSDPQNRRIGDIWIDPETIIIAALPKEMAASPDMGRRFTVIEEVLEYPSFASRLGGVAEVSDSPVPENTLEIDLFYDPIGWKSALLGKLDESMQWKEGLLIQAIRTHRPLVVYNLPEAHDLESFLRDLDSGEIYFSGERIQIPPGFRVYVRDRQREDLEITFKEGLHEADFFLSPETLPQFLGQITVENSRIEARPGVLSESMEPELFVQVTENLSAWQWRKLLDKKTDWQAKVIFIFPQGIEPPSFIKKTYESILSSPKSLTEEKLPGLYQSNDPEGALKTLKEMHPQATLVPVTASSRARNFMPEVINRAKTGFDFYLDKGPLFKLLEAGHTVILYGAISQSLLNELSPILVGKQKGYRINGSLYPIKGKVLLLHDSRSGKLTLKGEVLKVEPNALPDQESKIAKTLLEQKGLPVNTAAIERVILYRTLNLSDPLSYFKADGARAILYDNRVQEVIKAFQASPFLYLYGPPASGKSHFILDTLPKGMQSKFFYGKNRIEAFLESSEESVLCLDEGDLNPHLIEELMGLQKRPESFYFRRKFYKMSGFKGVILTGNGQFAGRKELKFIQTYGGALYFPAIPLPKIKEQILAPLLPNDETGKAFITRTLELFQVAQQEGNPLELRHLRSIAASYYFYQEHIPGWSGAQYAEIAFDDFCPDLSALENLETQFKSLRGYIVEEKLKSSNWNKAYVLTKSRKELYLKILRAVWLRTRKTPGLQRGLLIEGAAGEGKSDLVKKALLSLTQEVFEEIDMSDAPSSVREKLYNAFHAGRMIVVDEFDGIFEEEMNAYMTGFDLNGNRAETEGFFVFATANGNTYPFRLPRSEALESRFIQETIPPYTPEELEEVLVARGTDPGIAKSWILDHFKTLQETPFEILRPTPADLFSRVNEAVSNSKRDNHSLSPLRLPRKRTVPATV